MIQVYKGVSFGTSPIYFIYAYMPFWKFCVNLQTTNKSNQPITEK